MFHIFSIDIGPEIYALLVGKCHIKNKGKRLLKPLATPTFNFSVAKKNKKSNANSTQKNN